jgi:ferric-dicitrate binding protein FerR (iron transport regulator)
MEERIHILMSGYFLGNLKDTENLELKNHLESNPTDRKIFEDYRLLWEESESKIALKPIDVENDLIKTKLRLFLKKFNYVQFFQRAAAVLLLAVLFSSAYIYYYNATGFSDRDGHPVIVQEISTIYGMRTKFQLSDGTWVNLNSGSKLIFPTAFEGKTRKVELVGEAFFDVTPNPAKPFIVKTSEINVKVLGTAFDLQAYPGTNKISATLVHGKIVLERELAGISKQVAELKPSDRAVYKTDEKVVNISVEEDLDKFIAWKDGKLVFFNDPIENVAEKLGYWYNVTVKISNDKLKRYRFTATFTDEPIEQVLDLLSKSSPIKYQIKKAKRLADNSYSTREIIFN